MDAFLSGVEQAVRAFVVAAEAQLVQAVASQLSSGNLNVDWRVLAVGAAVAGLLGLDKWLHEAKWFPWKGISPV